MSAHGETLMELHFCTVCGVSIPNAQVDSGAAIGAAGETRCVDHRSGDVEETPDEPRAAPAGPPPEESALELLFCANCRVSVPLSDFRSGRARQEYGSLLCAVCVKADPGTRAARREAVEAEMAADVEANDPVGARRCTVCSAAVPQSHIVTGKATVDGQRVTCQACRAVSSGARGGGALRSAVLFGVVVAVAGSVGFLVGPLLLPAKDAPIGPLMPRIGALESDLATRLDGVAAARAADRDSRDQDLAGLRSSIEASLGKDLTEVRTLLASVRGDLAREDERTEQRLARLEGQLDEIVKRLAERAAEPPREVVVREPVVKQPDPPVRSDPPADEPVVPQVNPEVVRLAKDLLESKEDSVRFPAANELGRLGDEAAIPALAHALVHDEHFLVRRACARSLNMLKAWNATPFLIDALEDKEAYVAQQANFALRNITGQDFEVTQDQSVSERKRRSKKARKWWEDNQGSPPEGVSLHPATLEKP